MKIYRFEEETILNCTLTKAWDFFSNPSNLHLITPKELNFKILSEPCNQTYAGQIIHYSVTPIFGIPLQWVTEITHVAKERLFVDEQRFGPYRLWHHQHHFIETNGKVKMHDIVHYALYADPFSRLIAKVIVTPQIKKIFNYRAEKIVELM